MWMNNGTGQVLEMKAYIRVEDTVGGVQKTYYDGATVFTVNPGENEFDFLGAPVFAANTPTGFGMYLSFQLRFPAGGVPFVASVRAALSAGLPVNG